MTRLAIRLKLVAVLAALFLAIGGLPLAGYAQDDSGSPVAEQASEPAPPAAEEPAPSESEPPASPPPVVETAPPPAEESPSPAPTEQEPVFEAPVEGQPASPAPSESPAPSDDPANDPASPAAPGGGDVKDDSAAAPTTSDDSKEIEAAIEAADQAATINVAILAVNCPTVPATVVPGVVPEGCSAASGLKFEATVGAISLGTFTTNGGGLAQVGALEGEVLTVTEILSSVAAGYEAVSVSSTVTVGAGAALTLVHVQSDVEPVPPPAVGRLQLTQGQCPTSGETRTELTYIEPTSLRAAAEACHGLAGAEFQVTVNEADTLAASAVEGIKRTDASGNWRGELPVGSYTVTHVASGQSIDIQVVLDELASVVAIDYIHQGGEDEGTISIRRYACPSSVDTTEITVSPAEPTPREGCESEGGTFQLNNGEPFSGIDNDGAVTFTLPTGTYTFSDLTGGDNAGASLTIAAGATTWIMVERLMSPGDITVQFNACSAPVSDSQDPNNASFWTSACNNPVSGAAVQLVAAEGGVVGEATTDGGGFATFLDVATGTYQLRGLSGASTCAVFAGGQSALGGVQVSNGQFVQTQLFTCTKVASGPGGEIPGGGNPIPGNPGGGGAIKLPAPGPSDTQNPTVTQLPSTGSSNTVLGGQHIAFWFALLGAVSMAFLAIASAVRSVRQS